MVLFLDLIRKFSPKATSQWIFQLIKNMIKNENQNITEKLSDDLRSNTGMFMERIGSADNLSHMYLVPKSQVCKVIEEGSMDANLKLWLLGNDFNSPLPKDISGWQKLVKRRGNPCEVLTAAGKFPGSGRVGLFDGVVDGLEIIDDADFRIQNQLTNGLTLSQWVYPLTDSLTQVIEEEETVLNFDGVDDYIDCGNETELWSKPLTKFSFSFWVYTHNLQLNTRSLVDHGIVTAHSFACFRTNVGINDISFRIYNAAIGALTAVVTPAIPLVGRWAHVACVYDNSLGSQNLKIYCDGIVGATTANLTETINKSIGLNIGHEAFGGYLNGHMKDFRWWSDKALTAVEVQDIYLGEDQDITLPDYWLKMDETKGIEITDSIDGKIASLKNALGWLDITPGKNSALFDGVNDYITCGVEASLWSQALTKFSYSVWVRIDDLPIGTSRALVNHGGHVAQCFYSYIEHTSGHVVWRIVNAAGGLLEARAGPSTSLVGRWAHIVCVYDNSLPSANLRVYVDSVIGNTTANLKETINLSTTLFLGDLAWFATHMKGRMKDFRWWTTKALSQEEINAIYEGLGDHITPDFWLELNEGTGSTSADKITGTKFGTFTNGATWDDIYELVTQKLPTVIYSKKDDPNNQLALFLDPIDKSINVQMKKGGSYISRKSVGDNNALLSNGTSCSLDCGIQSSLWSAAHNKFSISFWIYPTARGSERGEVLEIIRHGWAASGSFTVYMYTVGAGNQIVASMRDHLGNGADNVSAALITEMNKWYFVIVVYDNSAAVGQKLRIHIDGAVSTNNTGTLTGTVGIVSAALTMYSGFNPDYTGLMKDFRWWNSKALTLTEINSIMNGLDDLTLKPDYWLKMDEGSGVTLRDAIDPTKTATINSNVKWRTMPNKYAIGFDGVNDYIDLTNDATLWSQALTKFSFSYWVRTNDITLLDKILVNHGDANAQGFRSFFKDTANGAFTFIIKNAAGTNFLAAGGSGASQGAWYHIVCVYDNSLGSANLKIYVNGVVGSITANLTETINLSTALLLCSNPVAGNSAAFNGSIKDFRWWTNRALTAAEVLNLYNGVENYIPNYWLRLDEGSGNPIDYISNTKTGILTNGALWVEMMPASPTGIIPYEPQYTRSKLPAFYYIDYKLNQWNFIVVVYNPTGDVIKIYSNSSLLNVTTVTARVTEPDDFDGHFAYTGPIPLNNGYSNIALRNIKWWKKQITHENIRWENTNKLSISKVTQAELPLVGYCTISP